MIQTQHFISFGNTYLFQKDNTSKQSLVVYCDILSDMHVINVFYSKQLLIFKRQIVLTVTIAVVIFLTRNFLEARNMKL